MKILIIDLGDRATRRLASTLRAEGHNVEMVSDLVGAVWVCSEASSGSGSGVDVAVLCLGRADPRMTELGARLRGSGSPVPLLVVAGVARTHEVVAALDAGADDVVVRPVTLTEIVARIRALARREAVPRAPALRVGDLELDPAAHTVHRAGRPVELSPLLFSLLEVFVRHPGQVLTREMLLEAVWDPATDARSNIVEQAVAALRRRVDHPFGRNSLQTVRGKGYRLEPGRADWTPVAGPFARAN